MMSLTSFAIIVRLSSLTELELSNNKFTGPIFSQLGSMTQLTLLTLQDNSLTGTIMSEIGKLSNMKLLLFDRNFLNGTIPTTVGTMSSLKSIHIWGNKLSGPIPSEMGLLSELTDISCKCYLLETLLAKIISHSLSDPLDFFVSFFFIVMNNLLTGTVPTTLGKLSLLADFVLFDNMLTGSMPFCDAFLARPKIDCAEIKCSCCQSAARSDCSTTGGP